MKDTTLAKKISSNQSNRNQNQTKKNKKIKLIHDSLQSHQIQLNSESQPHPQPQPPLECTSDWPNFDPKKSTLLLTNLIKIFKTELIKNQNLISSPHLRSTKPQKTSFKSNLQIKSLRKLNSSVLNGLVLGINSVNQKLNLIHNQTNSGLDLNPNIKISLILICKSDLVSSNLISHLPFMIHSINSQFSKPQEMKIELIELPIGSSLILSELIGIKSCTALAILDHMPGLDTLLKVL